MFNITNRFFSNSGFVKTALFTGVSTIVKIITGFFINKIIAIFAGPSGLAVIGNFQNFLSMLTISSTGAIDSGIVKYTAEYSNDSVKKKNIISSGMRIMIICSLVLSIILVVFHTKISRAIIQTDKYANIFLLLGFTIIFAALNIFLLSVLNGHKEVKKYVSVNIISSCMGLVLTLILTYYFSIIGALYSLIINQSLAVFISFLFVIKTKWATWQLFFSAPDKESVIKLLKYSAMIITSALTGPTALLIVRNHIGNSISWNAAGYWEGVSRISSVYLLLITSSISIYYLPRMSELKSKTEIKKELFSSYKIVLPVVVFLGFGIFIFKEYIIMILFTDSFKPMVDLFAFQLIGDFLKIASWLLSYLMIARAMTRVFIATEIIFNTSLVLLSLLFINNFGIRGVTYAYAINYFLYGITMVFIFRGIIYDKN